MVFDSDSTATAALRRTNDASPAQHRLYMIEKRKRQKRMLRRQRKRLDKASASEVYRHERILKPAPATQVTRARRRKAKRSKRKSRKAHRQREVLMKQHCFRRAKQQQLMRGGWSPAEAQTLRSITWAQLLAHQKLQKQRIDAKVVSSKSHDLDSLMNGAFSSVDDVNGNETSQFDVLLQDLWQAHRTELTMTRIAAKTGRRMHYYSSDNMGSSSRDPRFDGTQKGTTDGMATHPSRDRRPGGLSNKDRGDIEAANRESELVSLSPEDAEITVAQEDLRSGQHAENHKDDFEKWREFPACKPALKNVLLSCLHGCP